MTFRKAILVVHLWLGLASGLVVMLLGATGCILVFEKEIKMLIGADERMVEKQAGPKAAPSKVFSAALASIPAGGENLYFSQHGAENAALITWHYTPPAKKGGEGSWLKLEQDPYTGAVLSKGNWSEDFWGTMTRLHTHLLLPPDFGGPITGYATLVFLVMLITGIILWMPKSRKGYKQRFRVKWGASFKRLNYDLHNVLGFYMTWVIIFTAITGLLFAFEGLRNAVYTAASGKDAKAIFEQPKSAYTAGRTAPTTAAQLATIDRVVPAVLARYTTYAGYTVSYPMDSTAAIGVAVSTTKGQNYDRHDEYFFDRYTGALVAQELWADQNAGDRIVHLVYPVHVGSIGGIAGKVAAFLASLIATSLPVTGFIIWRGKKGKKRGVRRRIALRRPRLRRRAKTNSAAHAR